MSERPGGRPAFVAMRWEPRPVGACWHVLGDGPTVDDALDLAVADYAARAPQDALVVAEHGGVWVGRPANAFIAAGLGYVAVAARAWVP